MTNDGRNLMGIMRGCDQFVNIILERCKERVFSLDSPVEEVSLGLYLVKGDNVALVGQLDMARDAQIRDGDGSFFPPADHPSYF